MLPYTCPCCGYKTLDSDGGYDICPICFWEDDPFQKEHMYEDGGANTVSLIKAQKNYSEFGACERHVIQYTRKPVKGDKKDPGWRPIEDASYQIKLVCDDFREGNITIDQLENRLSECDAPVRLEAVLDKARQEIDTIRFCTSAFQQKK
ncbi:Cysteine-rich CPCC [Terribacillus halophilus]|uniref:Cysteine-rich CPCC n=1 Tax=Terribacillus halophilus TaxID=361279 RepID=A0A1G6JEP1_9BACI|nr:Cysteine-rich CPCC [Terribacillus halophilus]